MNKTNVWTSIVAAGAAVGLLTYVIVRRTGDAQRALPRSSGSVALTTAAGAPELAANASTSIRRIAPVAEGADAPSVQLLMKAPPLLGSDDAETLDSDDLGGAWLARAAQSEPSLREADLEIPLEDIADPTEDPSAIESDALATDA